MSSNGSQTENRQGYRIFALPAGFSGCAFWRFRLPLGKLIKLGSPFEIHIADNADKRIRMEDIQKNVDGSDAIILQAPGNKDAKMLIGLYRSQGKKVIVEYDDFSFDLSESNPRYAELGIQERGNWRNMENGFDLKSNIERHEAFKDCVRAADLVTTTTEHLADKFLELNPKVAICPNSIDFDRWKPIPRPDALNGQVRIGWFGGDSHLVDLDIFKTVMPKIMSEYPETKTVIQAPPVPAWNDVFSALPKERMEWHGWKDLKYYTLALAAKWWNIGLCPLADNEFNRCKSNIKWLEFAALRVPVVAQNMLPYSEHIIHGITGFLASTEAEWYDCISELVKNPQLRVDMAEEAYRYVKAHFDLDKNCRIWEREYMNCIEGAHVGKI